MAAPVALKAKAAQAKAAELPEDRAELEANPDLEPVEPAKNLEQAQAGPKDMAPAVRPVVLGPRAPGPVAAPLLAAAVVARGPGRVLVAAADRHTAGQATRLWKDQA